MIVQCERCKTKYRLDDERVRDEGVKVRCSKCKYIFMVTTEQKVHPFKTSAFDEMLTGVDVSMLTQPSDDQAYSPGSPLSFAEEHPINESGVEDWIEQSPVSTGPFGELSSEGGRDVAVPETKPADAWHESEHQEEPPVSLAWDEAAATSELNIGWGSAEQRDEEVQPVEPGESLESEPWETQTSDSEMRVDSGLPSEIWSLDEVTVVADTEPAPKASLDDQHVDFPPEISGSIERSQPEETTSFDNEPSDKSTDSGILWEPGEEKSEVFQEEFASSAALSLQSEPVEEGKSEEKSETIVEPSISPSTTVPDELPPLAIASRRKGTSFIPIAVAAVSVVFIIALAVAGFYMLNEGPAAFRKMGLSALVEWAGLDGGEEGSITLRNTKSEFIVNREVGEIFVIKGEAVNAFRKPRASIQIKATLYGPKGEPIISRMAYCGNVLTREQLITLPLGKMELAMGNQFGDSLANLGVQPGKAIPFVVVFAKVPKEITEFGLEVAGSTVASP